MRTLRIQRIQVRDLPHRSIPLSREAVSSMLGGGCGWDHDCEDDCDCWCGISSNYCIRRGKWGRTGVCSSQPE